MKPAPSLPRIPPLELNGYSFDVQHYLNREYMDIQDASVELPSVIEWLNYQTQIYMESKMATKAALEREEAQAYFALKGGEFQRKGYGDKTTEDALKRAVDLDEGVIKLKEDLAVYSPLVERLIRIQQSLQFKLELVRSSEATRRALVSN